MAEIVTVKLVAETGDAVKNVEKVDEAVKKTAKTAKKASKELSGMQQVGNEAVKGLDKLTGGLASKLVAVGKAAKLSGKAMRTALISSGIGLAVAAVGLLVEYWDEIGEALGFINKDLERQVELNNQNLDAVGVRLRNIQTLIELRKREGKDVDLLLKKEKELTEQKKQAFVTSIQDQALLVNRLKLKQKEGKLNEEETQELIKQENVYLDLLNNFNKFKSDLLEPVKEVVKKDTSATEAEKLAEQQRLKAIDDKASSIEEITKLEDDYLQSKLSKEQQEINAVRDKYFTQIEEAKKYNLDTKLLEEARLSEINDIEKKFEEEREEERAEARAKKMDAFNKRRDDRLKTIKENAERELEIEEQLEDAKFRVASQALDAISSIGKLFAGENEKNAKIAFRISKAVGIAQVGINTSQAIMKAAAETTDVTPTQSLRTANMIALGVAGAAQIASIAAQKFQGGSSTVPKPSMGGGSQAPAFNVVGASGETQLADAIGSQTQRPARAYVVSNDVTTAQEMDRNIIEGASIG